MLAITPMLFALVVSAQSSAPTVSEIPEVRAVAKHADFVKLVGSSCLTVPADMTKTLKAGKTSVSAVQPNVSTTVTIPDGDGEPEDTCKAFVVDIKVPSTSTPPGGYTKKFDITGTVDGTYVYDDYCNDGWGGVGIYRKNDDGLDWKGGGNLDAAWSSTVDPKVCTFSPTSSFVNVSGRVPDSGTRTFRVIVYMSAGTGIVKVTRERRVEKAPPPP